MFNYNTVYDFNQVTNFNVLVLDTAPGLPEKTLGRGFISYKYRYMLEIFHKVREELARFTDNACRPKFHCHYLFPIPRYDRSTGKLLPTLPDPENDNRFLSLERIHHLVNPNVTAILGNYAKKVFDNLLDQASGIHTDSQIGFTKDSVLVLPTLESIDNSSIQYQELRICVTRMTTAILDQRSKFGKGIKSTETLETNRVIIEPA